MCPKHGNVTNTMIHTIFILVFKQYQNKHKNQDFTIDQDPSPVGPHEAGQPEDPREVDQPEDPSEVDQPEDLREVDQPEDPPFLLLVLSANLKKMQI